MNARTMNQRGFTLVEVLVALAIIAVGMLGIAKMQALALSSTGVSRTRALAAIEAASLADSMHANRRYWSTGLGTTATVAISATNGTATSGNGTVSAALAVVAGQLAGSTPNYSTYCQVAAPCTGANIAGSDLYNWALDLKSVLPNATGSISCNGTSIPVDCTIVITWVEAIVGANSQESAAAQANATAGNTAVIQQPTYTLYVVP